MITRAEIVAEARSWIGTPWLHQASVRGAGCDCIGLIVGVGAALGVPEAMQWLKDPSFRTYGRLPDPALLLQGATTYLDRIKIREASLGDTLLFHWEGGPPRHFGIVTKLEPMYMVHALAQARRVTEHRIDELWQSRIVMAFRAKGLVDG